MCSPRLALNLTCLSTKFYLFHLLCRHSESRYISGSMLFRSGDIKLMRCLSMDSGSNNFIELSIFFDNDWFNRVKELRRLFPLS